MSSGQREVGVFKQSGSVVYWTRSKFGSEHGVFGTEGIACVQADYVTS